MAKIKRLNINEQINASEVRLISSSGEQLGIIPKKQALNLARKENLDLVEVASSSVPQVCKILDYNKYLFTEKRKISDSKKKQKQMSLKEVKFRSGIGDADYLIKKKKIMSLLEEGNKIKISLRFRGREIVHKNIGMKIFDRLKEDLVDFCSVDLEPKSEGRQIIMSIIPKLKKSNTKK